MSEFTDLQIDLQLIEQYVSGKRPIEDDNYSKFTDLLEASSKNSETGDYVEKRQKLIQRLSEAIESNRESFEIFVNHKDTSYDVGKYYRMRYYITLALAQVNQSELNDTCNDDEIMAFINNFNEQLTMSGGKKQRGGSGSEIATMILQILSNSEYVNQKVNNLGICFQKVVAYMVSGKIREKLEATDEQGRLKIFSGLVNVGVDIKDSLKKIDNNYVDEKIDNISTGFNIINDLMEEFKTETDDEVRIQAENDKIKEIAEKNEKIDDLVEFIELMKQGLKGSEEHVATMEIVKEAQDKTDTAIAETIDNETKEAFEKTKKLEKRTTALKKLAEARRSLRKAAEDAEKAAEDAEDAANKEVVGGKRKTKKNKKKMTKSKKHFKKQSRKILKKLSKKKKGKKH